MSSVPYKARAWNPGEAPFFFAQCTAVEIRSGYIGRYQGDFGKDGLSFHVSWEDGAPGKMTPQFEQECALLLKGLHEGANNSFLLKDYTCMKAYCGLTPNADLGQRDGSRGFRLDTGLHTYMLRCIPELGDASFYIYCYHTQALDTFLEKAKEGIRFITPQYNDLFRAPDDGRVSVRLPNGTKKTYVCRYLDSTHFEMMGEVWHICQFAEQMQALGQRVEPLDVLPAARTHDKNEPER